MTNIKAQLLAFKVYNILNLTKLQPLLMNSYFPIIRSYVVVDRYNIRVTLYNLPDTILARLVLHNRGLGALV